MRTVYIVHDAASVVKRSHAYLVEILLMVYMILVEIIVNDYEVM